MREKKEGRWGEDANRRQKEALKQTERGDVFPGNYLHTVQMPAAQAQEIQLK